MRISIDATPLLLRSAGVKTYVYQWIAHMRKLGGGHEIRTFPFFGSIGELQHEESMVSGWSTLAGLALLHFCNIPGNPAIDMLGARADVFHASHQLRTAPRNTRVTATVYDMTCWLIPEMHSPSNVRVGQRFGDRVLKRADGLIAISENTRTDCVRILGIDPDKIEVIYPGVADAFFEPGAESIRTAQEKHSISRPYILFVGTVEPRKNLDTLLDAWEGINRALLEEFDLVIAGPAGWANPHTLNRLNSGIAGVRYLGYVAEQDLPGLTAGAAAFVYPSLYEGFGLPVAQAMAAGVPIVTSNNSSLPEVAGDAAVLADPKSSNEIRAALERLLTSPSTRCELAKNGIARAQPYRWDVCARRSLQFFEKVARK
jgi:glycosyltransferase involved in cell wall biosynthesis